MTTSPTASVPARGAGLAGVLEIARRRRLRAIVPFLLVLAAAASLACFLPGLWRARSLIMVDRPQVPESMVKSTVVSDLEGQLISMSQEIMSRPRLAAIIQRYNLYARVRQSFGMDEAVERMRKDIKLEIQGDPERRRRREPRTMMFSVAYSSSSRWPTRTTAGPASGGSSSPRAWPTSTSRWASPRPGAASPAPT